MTSFFFNNLIPQIIYYNMLEQGASCLNSITLCFDHHLLANCGKYINHIQYVHKMPGDNLEITWQSCLARSSLALL